MNSSHTWNAFQLSGTFSWPRRPRKSCLGARKRFDSHQDIFVQVFLILSRNLRLEGFLLQSCPDSVPNSLISQDFDFTLWHVFGEIHAGRVSFTGESSIHNERIRSERRNCGDSQTL